MKVAIIGAGIAGLQLANRLRAEGAEIQVFEKSRGPSGRLATRRTDEGSFDHGAQYFTARNPGFVEQVEDWSRRGVVRQWQGKVVRIEDGIMSAEQDAPIRHVGSPRMSVIGRDLARGIPMELSVRIESIRREAGLWLLEADDGRAWGGFDLVLLGVPAPQAVPLLVACPLLARRAEAVRMLPCHALMVRFDSEWAVDFDAAFVGSSSLGWIARNASKPNREDEANWVLHSTAEWSEAHLDLGGEEIRAELLGDLEALLGAPLPAVRCFAAHRWLYARPMGPFDTSSLVWDREIGLGACGDWVCGDRVEDAFLSAERLADAIRIR